MAVTGWYGPGWWGVGSSRMADFARLYADLFAAHAALDARLAPQAANPDTSGVSLEALEVEVNQLKAALRTAEIIT